MKCLPAGVPEGTDRSVCSIETWVGWPMMYQPFGVVARGQGRYSEVRGPGSERLPPGWVPLVGQTTWPWIWHIWSLLLPGAEFYGPACSRAWELSGVWLALHRQCSSCRARRTLVQADWPDLQGERAAGRPFLSPWTKSRPIVADQVGAVVFAMPWWWL